jgi:hypothetical protein
MGNLPPLLDLICGFRTGRRLSDEPSAGFGCPAWDRRGDLVFGAAGFCRPKMALRVAVGRRVGAAGEIATSDGSGVEGWRQGCDGNEPSSPIDGIGHSRGWQPGLEGLDDDHAPAAVGASVPLFVFETIFDTIGCVA